LVHGQAILSSFDGGITMGKKPTVKPGAKVPDSGIYQDQKSGNKSTMVKGEPAPPTPKPGGLWKQVVDTNPDN